VEQKALEELLKPYLDNVSRKFFELSGKHLGDWDVQGLERWVEACGVCV